MAESTIEPDEAGEDVVVRPFADWLREQSGGKTHDELSDGLHDLIGRVRDTGKKGSITLVVTLSPMKGDTDVLCQSPTCPWRRCRSKTCGVVLDLSARRGLAPGPLKGRWRPITFT